MLLKLFKENNYNKIPYMFDDYDAEVIYCVEYVHVSIDHINKMYIYIIKNHNNDFIIKSYDYDCIVVGNIYITDIINYVSSIFMDHNKYESNNIYKYTFNDGNIIIEKDFDYDGELRVRPINNNNKIKLFNVDNFYISLLNTINKSNIGNVIIVNTNKSFNNRFIIVNDNFNWMFFARNYIGLYNFKCDAELKRNYIDDTIKKLILTVIDDDKNVKTHKMIK